MKKILYAVCASSLALAVSASATDYTSSNNLQRKGRGTQKAPTTQGASFRNSAQTNLRHYNLNRPIPQQRAAGTASSRDNGVVYEHGLRHYNMGNRVIPSGSSFNENHPRGVTVDRERNFETNRSRNVIVDRQRHLNEGVRNVEINRERNITRNREHSVTINNNWHGTRLLGPPYSAFRNYHREWHDRNWWRGHHTHIIFVSGGWYYWNLGYWYPAWGYDPGCRYQYDGPIYGYNNLTPDQVVANVQEQLAQDGYYTGPIDGELGPMTRQAIADFQADHGLAITSAVDEPTLASLGLV